MPPPMNSNGKEPVFFQHPQFGSFVGRVSFHQRAGTGSGATADIDLAAGGTVRGGVAAVAFEDDGGAGIQPADIGRRRAVDDDLGAGKAEGSNTLAGVFNREFKRRAVRGPERSADVVMAGRENFKFGLSGLQGGVDLLQQLLGGDTPIIFIKAIDKGCHYLKPP